MPASSRARPGPARYALLGSPVAHSLSPAMQRAAFAAAGIAADYDAIDVPAPALEGTLRDLHRRGFAGLNLTAPLKECVRPFLAGATEEAERLGSVNTLLRTEEGWRGDATDGAGFEVWAREARLPFASASVALLGAGGAARAVAPHLSRLGARAVTVVARDARRASAVAESAAGWGGAASWRAQTLGEGGPEGTIDVLLRALAAPGIAPTEEPWWEAVEAGGIVIDLNYASMAAAARSRATRLGRRYEDGLGMLLHQGALAFERWTGRRAPLEAMRRALAAAT